MDKDKELIYHLEELAANAWPARITQTVGGWRLRYTDGVTRRANSVWPNLAPSGTQPTQSDLDARLAAVEEFYAERNLPARFQICPAAQPSGLDKVLATNGYTDDALTHVQVSTIDNILNGNILNGNILNGNILNDNSLAKIEADHGNKVTITQQINDAWFEGYCQSEALDAHAIHVRRGILQRIAPTTGFASINASPQASPDALGLGVVERGWLGIFCMTTKAESRRRGLASSLLRGLASWAAEQGATKVYLQVMASNSAAQKLYNRYGFNTVYQYHYREKK